MVQVKPSSWEPAESEPGPLIPSSAVPPAGGFFPGLSPLPPALPGEVPAAGLLLAWDGRGWQRWLENPEQAAASVRKATPLPSVLCHPLLFRLIKGPGFGKRLGFTQQTGCPGLWVGILALLLPLGELIGLSGPHCPPVKWDTPHEVVGRIQTPSVGQCQHQLSLALWLIMNAGYCHSTLAWLWCPPLSTPSPLSPPPPRAGKGRGSLSAVATGAQMGHWGKTPSRRWGLQRKEREGRRGWEPGEYDSVREGQGVSLVWLERGER